MKRKARDLSEPPDIVLAETPRMIRAWLKGGPCDGTTIEVPQGTEELWAYDFPPEIALTPEDAAPALVRYEWDLNMRGGGFSVMRAAERLPFVSHPNLLCRAVKP